MLLLRLNELKRRNDVNGNRKVNFSKKGLYRDQDGILTTEQVEKYPINVNYGLKQLNAQVSKVLL